MARLTHSATPFTIPFMLALLCSLALCAQEPASSIPRHFRVLWETSPATQASISWTTSAPGESHRVHLDTQSHAGSDTDYPLTFDSAWDGAYTRSARELERVPAAHFHHAHVTNLKPDTVYWFVVQSDGELSRELHFRTAPDEDVDFALLYGGDSRTGRADRQLINDRIASMAAADPAIRCFVHGGDYIENGNYWWQWDLWLEHFQRTIGRDGMLLPLIAARGNHDVGPLFNQVFNRPGIDGQNYYITDLSPAAALVTLNTEISAAGDQALWLEETLGSLRPEKTWLLAQYHRPAWPAIKQPSSGLAHWVPLFEQFDVDLVLESDGHCMKRTLPIRGGAHDPTGVTYIGEGGLGVPQRRPDKDRWFLQSPGFTGSAHHITRLDFGASELRSRFYKIPMASAGPELADLNRIRPEDSPWSYLAGEDPELGWARPDHPQDAWSTGQAGFGYPEGDLKTLLDDMRGEYSRVYLRASFDSADVQAIEKLALMISYDDAFIAYLNGIEMCRAGVEGRGSTATAIQNHEATRFEYFEFPAWREALSEGANILAIEGHNRMLASSDFSLWPILVEGAQEQPLGELEVVDDHRLEVR